MKILNVKEPFDSSGRFVCLYPTNEQKIIDLKKQLIIHPTTDPEYTQNCSIAEEIRKWKRISASVF